MIKLGLIARADNSGLGVQTLEFHRHMRPAKTLVINVGHLYNSTTHANKATYLDRYPGAMVYNDWSPNVQVLVEFLDGLDAVFTAETWYSDQFVQLARRMGVHTVQQYNFEFLQHLNNPHLDRPDVFAAPSMWRWDDVPFPNKTFLPVPIATDRFTPRASDPGPRHFVHIVGRPAIYDRNGTPDLLAALHHVHSEIRLTLRCQDRDYLRRLAVSTNVPGNVELRVDSSDVRDYWELYDRGDVLIMPRRYGGLCLPANEALGAGMPVIMTNIDPNNTWLPPEWLVPAHLSAEFMAFNRVDVFAANHVALGAKIDEFCERDFYATAKARADELAKEYSWDQLKPEYERVLTA